MGLCTCLIPYFCLLVHRGLGSLHGESCSFDFRCCRVPLDLTSSLQILVAGCCVVLLCHIWLWRRYRSLHTIAARHPNAVACHCNAVAHNIATPLHMQSHAIATPSHAIAMPSGAIARQRTSLNSIATPSSHPIATPSCAVTRSRTSLNSIATPSLHTILRKVVHKWAQGHDEQD